MYDSAQNVLTHNYHHAYPKYGFDSYVIKNAQQIPTNIYLFNLEYCMYENMY